MNVKSSKKSCLERVILEVSRAFEKSQIHEVV